MNKAFNFRKIVALAMVTFALAKVSAQSPDLFFEKDYPYPILSNYFQLKDRPLCYITEIAPDGESEGFCLMTANYYRHCFIFESEPFSQPLIYKISHHGELLGELLLGYTDCYSFIQAVYQALDDPNCFLAIGRKHDKDLHYDRLFMARFDRDLNLLWQKEIEFPENYHDGFFFEFGSVMDSDGNIVCSSSLFECGNIDALSRFVFRLTPEGVLEAVVDMPFDSMFQQVFEFPDGSGDYGLLEEEGYYTNDSKVILHRMNRNLELIGRKEFPHKYEEMDPTNLYPSLWIQIWDPGSCHNIRHGIIPFPDGSLLFSNEASVTHQDIYQGIFEHEYGIGFMWLDPDGEPVFGAMAGETTLHDSIRMTVPKLIAGDNGFYFVYKIGENNLVPDYMNEFVVGKMDWDGNLLWLRYWNRFDPENDMKVYFADDVALSHDGGCLVSGFSYESLINYSSDYEYNPKVFLLKFFADGSLSVHDKESNVHIRPYLFYPNPVKDRLRLSFSPDVVPVMAELFDSMGRLVLSQDNGLETIVMESLPAGVYTLRVTLGNGTSYSDPVVKQ